MKNPKAIYKYTHTGEVGYMHYVVFEGKVVVLSKLDSLKINFIEENGKLEVTANIKDNNYSEVKCKVERDLSYVQKVYDYMQETNNSYFNEGIEGLCAIIFEK
jgi:hypothetical protein